jgi:hypothetical protein
VSTNQELRQASVEAVTGTKWDYNSDWSALFDAAGIATNLDWDGRFLAWINLKLSASYTNLPGAMAALAVNAGALDWSGLGTFSAAIGGGGSHPTYFILGF